MSDSKLTFTPAVAEAIVDRRRIVPEAQDEARRTAGIAARLPAATDTLGEP